MLRKFLLFILVTGWHPVHADRVACWLASAPSLSHLDAALLP